MHREQRVVIPTFFFHIKSYIYTHREKKPGKKQKKKKKKMTDKKVRKKTKKKR